MLTFYFYMKANLKGFIVSSLLLVGTVDVAPLMGITLGIGLVIYEFVYNKKERPDQEQCLLCICTDSYLTYCDTALFHWSIWAREQLLCGVSELSPSSCLFKINIGAQNTIGPGLSRTGERNPIGKIANLGAFAMGYRA